MSARALSSRPTSLMLREVSGDEPGFLRANSHAASTAASTRTNATMNHPQVGMP